MEIWPGRLPTGRPGQVRGETGNWFSYSGWKRSSVLLQLLWNHHGERTYFNTLTSDDCGDVQILAESHSFVLNSFVRNKYRADLIRVTASATRTRKMVAFRVKLCSSLLTFLLVLNLGSALPDNQRNDGDLTQEVVSSMNRVLNFFKRDFKSINLDGIFGLRVAQGWYWYSTITLKFEFWTKLFSSVDTWNSAKKLNVVTCISTVKPNLFADRGVFYKLFIYLSEYSIFEIGKPLHLAQISVQLYGF